MSGVKRQGNPPARERHSPKLQDVGDRKDHRGDSAPHAYFFYRQVGKLPWPTPFIPVPLAAVMPRQAREEQRVRVGRMAADNKVDPVPGLSPRQNHCHRLTGAK